jgi:hypothetical protein
MGGVMKQEPNKTKEGPKPKKRVFGIDKGKVFIHDDFDDIPPEWDIFSDEFWEERDKRKGLT